jgi:hypothetical protein
MSTTAPRCHLCHEEKTMTPSGYLVCDHCDKPCVSARSCARCAQGQKSDGRGPHS